MKYRQELFPGTPCIFCGINYIDLYDLSDEHNITGISEDFDIPANLELIKNLPLGIRNIAVVTDSTTTGRADLARFREESPPYEEDFDFIYLSDLTIEELSERLQALPERTAVLNLSFWRDRNNEAFEPDEIMPLISKTSGAPVLGARDYFIVGGTFGGIVSSSEIQGKLLAETAIEVLEGTPADLIPIHREKTTEPFFDYMVIKSFGIKISDLPNHSVLLNTPDSLYYRAPERFWIILSVIASQSLLLLFLGTNIHRRKQSEHLFKSLFNHIPDMVIVHSKNGKILQENLSAAADRDFLRRELIELNKTRERIFPTTAPPPDDSGNAVKKEIAYYVPQETDPDKALRHFEINSVRIRYQGKFEILSIFRDITSRKNFESELKESLAEKDILIQEVHHRVKNNLQIISSLLDLQASFISDKTAVKTLLDSKRRIMTMAQAHEKLYQSDSLSKINLNSYILSLTELFTNQGAGDLIVNMECNDINVNIDMAVTLGLILNELFSNSIKYAFTDTEIHEITISCTTSDYGLQLIYSDSGPGFDFNSKKQSSLGLKLVEALLTQIKAEFCYDRQKGSKFIFNIPCR